MPSSGDMDGTLFSTPLTHQGYRGSSCLADPLNQAFSISALQHWGQNSLLVDGGLSCAL